ncbi:MAG: shikimate kinase [Bacteroidia bacterium]|jgi:shikimate kinase
MTHQLLFLVGPMGAGKSTIGRLLADELGLEFRDADREIEACSGVNIPWIFEKEGESGFRERETAMLDELSQLSGVLVSTGGGVVGRRENFALMRRGVVVYLHASVNEQVKRTAKDKKRPLLQNANPRTVLSELMEKRDPLYRELANFVVDTDGRSPRTVVNELKRLMDWR